MQGLAKLLRLDELPEAYVPDQHTRKLRAIIRHRIALVKLRTRLKNQVHSVLHKAGITIELSDIFGKRGPSKTPAQICTESLPCTD